MDGNSGESCSCFWTLTASASFGIGLGTGMTGYYVGLSADIARHKVIPTLDQGQLKIFDGGHLHKEFKDTLYGTTFTVGYMYALGPIALAGQVYFGMGSKRMPLHDTWKIERESIPLTVHSDLDLWGRWRFGWELLGGVKVSSVLVYGLLGFQCRMMQTRGHLTLIPNKDAPEEVAEEKAILFLEKPPQQLREWSLQRSSLPIRSYFPRQSVLVFGCML